MNFIIEETLKEYMKQVNKRYIVVEVVIAENSDIEITELHVHLINEKQAAYFKEKKRYCSYEIEAGEVLLPRFPLQYEENIRFWLKTFLWFKSVEYEEIRV